MNIWRTSPPTPQDFPIWAYLGDAAEDVVLCRHRDAVPGDTPVTWCRAEIPTPPEDSVREKYEELSQISIGKHLTTYDWFAAGYLYGKGSTSKRQAAKSPFVNPEDYWEELDQEGNLREPYESAYDERV